MPGTSILTVGMHANAQQQLLQLMQLSCSNTSGRQCIRAAMSLLPGSRCCISLPEALVGA